MRQGSEVSLVRAELADADLIYSFMQGLRQDDPMPHYDFADHLAIRDAMESLIINPDIGRLWVIRAQGKTVGYVVLSFVHILEFAGRCALLDEFYIEPDSRRKGFAKAALVEICRIAGPELGIRAIFLERSQQNRAAYSLYHSMGFEERPYNLMIRSTFEQKEDW